MTSSLVEYLIYHYGHISANYIGNVVRWADVGIWSAVEDARQIFLGF